MEANLVEIFSSVQGEGPDVGASTLFVRFGECDLRCRWCDTPHTWRPARECRFEVRRGSAEFRTVANPIPIAAAIEAAEALEVARHRFVSLTGGEPLLQPAAAAAIGAALRTRGPRIHLETHGIAVAGLSIVLPHVDVVSMDWKLASDVRRASDAKDAERGSFAAEHAAFLAIARTAPRLVVKIVVTPASGDSEIDEAIAAVAELAPDATLVLQPVTPHGPVRERPSAARMLALSTRAEERLRDVRVIPQTHPIYGVL
jgi:7-carboxy-7-deazaguanine synthase